MCVIFFYANSNPQPGGYKLILASNRDEFYHRKTRSVTKWSDVEHVYGGIDLEPGREGGTWLAIGGSGGVFKVGALLNLTGEPRPQNAVGRGMIVSDFVTSTDDVTIDDYNKNLLMDCGKYAAFNFVGIEIGSSFTPARITVLSNSPPGLEDFTEGKCYGFGNSLPAEPFQKVRHGQHLFEKTVRKFIDEGGDCQEVTSQQELVGNLLNLLKSRQRLWPDEELRRRAPNWGERLSSLNVYMPEEGYGSRTHSVVLVDADDKMHFYEETMTGLDPEGEWQRSHIERQYFSEK